jgi:hypothetical protein
MRNERQVHTRPLRAPRLQRTAAAVIAQYIQDLTHPAEPGPGAPGA